GSAGIGHVEAVAEVVVHGALLPPLAAAGDAALRRSREAGLAGATEAGSRLALAWPPRGSCGAVPSRDPQHLSGVGDTRRLSLAAAAHAGARHPAGGGKRRRPPHRDV